jgi:tRNA(Ile)-lysidine synthase
LRLLRGSGPAGLAGIAPKRGIYIRPLLECSRSEILHYLDRHRLPYFTDTSNASLAFQRNRIRNELIPYLQKHFNPAVVDALWKSSRWLQEQNELVRELLRPYKSLLNRTEEGIEMDRPRFLQLSHPLRKALLKLAIQEADAALLLQARTLHGALDAVVDGKDFQLPGYLQLHTAGEKVCFIRKKVPGPLEIDVPHDGSFEFPPANRQLNFQTCGRCEIAVERNLAYLDAKKASFPLCIRNPRRGDSFQPLGMSGHKKLSDFFIDRKIPRSERKRIPLVVKDETIVWVAGHQIDNEFRVTEKTDKILRIEIRDNV